MSLKKRNDKEWPAGHTINSRLSPADAMKEKEYRLFLINWLEYYRKKADENYENKGDYYERLIKVITNEIQKSIDNEKK